ncbi:hypothetical protein FH609_000945 [Streptomyces sp. 3MP-14]|uniref:Uncharacterized protein n=1 Tax=Streptomyces mimosae TaxID=2586635 RepID=A0A5N6ASE9_9ACTN|nr:MULTISPECIES: hypothetical protein [Streptomyces]KAB8171033.1 hypothetical protein FH607_001525 [Streptomyces mimosae]KAB8179616.1 hypothetical protein FH609_000945 [Streptomyces sp. 3MP-14]
MHDADDTERLETALRAADPLRDRALADDPEGPLGLRVLTRARGRARHHRLRRAVLVPATALAVAGATAGAYAWTTDPGQPHSSWSVTCVVDGIEIEIGPSPAEQDPVLTCGDYWADSWVARPEVSPPPAELTACVDNAKDDPLRVYPGGAGTCEELGIEPYTGLSEEQLRLAELREELHQNPDDCRSREEVAALADRLFDEHHLDGWTTRAVEADDAHAVSDSPCTMISTYDEVNRTVLLTGMPEITDCLPENDCVPVDLGTGGASLREREARPAEQG